MNKITVAAGVALAMSASALTQAKNIDYKASVEVVPSTDGAITRDHVTGYVFHDRNRNGQFDRRERGIPGVMVSNGIDVVRTDFRGQYKLPALVAGLEDFTVFVTKPAHFDVPTDEDNVPQFFYHHKPLGSSEPLRFGGLPATGPQPAMINFPMVKARYKHSFKVAVSGDTQPYSNNEVSYVRDALANELATMEDLEFVMIEGDVMGDDLGLFPRFKNIMSVAEAPQYYVPGNHDIDFDASDDAESFDTFKREWGPTYYSFDIGQVHFVVLDNVRYPCTPEIDNAEGGRDFCNDPENRPTYNGRVTEEQLQWLANDLAHVPEHKLIVLNMHIPLVAFVDNEATKHQTDNVAEIYELIGDRPALALSGHTHTLEQFRPGEFYEGWEEAVGAGPTPFPQIVTGATSGSWWSGDFDAEGIPMALQRLGGPRGYLLFEFKGNTYKETFKASGKPLDDQMHIDFLSPTFMAWYGELRAWKAMDPNNRPETPPVSINDLPDTSIITADDIAGGTYVMTNVWNGSRDSKVYVQVDGGEPLMAARTQDGAGEGQRETIDPFAVKRQLYVLRYAIKSESGNERTQGFELWSGAGFGPADPQPLDEWMLTDQSTHVWKVALPSDLEAGSHTLTVTTIDVHGRKFSETKTFEVMDTRPPGYFRADVFE